MNDKTISYDDLIRYFSKFDSELTGRVGSRLSLYCLEGTALTITKRKNFSYDMDFIISRQDNIPVSEISGALELSEGFRVDPFVDGEFLDFYMPHDFKDYSRCVLSLENMDVYVLSSLDLFVLKGVASRDKDKLDMGSLKYKPDRDKILTRFEDLRFKTGRSEMKDKMRNNLVSFLDIVYAD
ncbi:MAG: hypothetical protein ACI83O_000176 [Patescibacteria group bacterium]|jgi:hypothetical protein